MTQPTRRLFLLGPQPKYTALQAVLARIEMRGPVALISAGWETDEQQDHNARAAIGGPCINLNLFARTEELFVRDPDLIEGLRKRQDELRLVRDAYRQRLSHLLRAARQMIRRSDGGVDLSPERESAIEMVRQLDRENVARTTEIIDNYESILQTASRPLVAAHRREISEALQQCSLIAIAGGHVAIILNRLKIFGVLEAAPELPIIAWSGGTMALAEQVVFYHDSPPQGPGNAEVLRRGMGLFDGILPLPYADTRLALEDRTRVTLFARRFSEFRCVAFDEGTILERVEGHWRSTGTCPARYLGRDGQLEQFDA